MAKYFFIEYKMDKYVYLRFTFWNLIALLLSYLFGFQSHLDILRTTVFIFFIIALYILIRGYNVTVYTNKNLPTPFQNNVLIAHVTNALTHFVPFLLLGIPTNKTDIVIGYTIAVIWYLMVRDYIQTLYTEEISTTEYDGMAFLLVPSSLILSTFWINVHNKFL